MSITRETAQPDDAGGRRSPFTGADVCAAAGLRIVPGGHAVLFDQDALTQASTWSGPGC